MVFLSGYRCLAMDNNKSKLKDYNTLSVEVHTPMAYPFPPPPTLSTIALLSPPPLYLQIMVVPLKTAIDFSDVHRIIETV